MAIKYSIVIPTYNHCDDLLRPCIESIVRYTDLSRIEIIVVANGCTDNTREYLMTLDRRYNADSLVPITMIWYDDPKGYTYSTNRGIEQASGEYVILLNNDIVLLDQPINSWINLLSKPFSDPTVGSYVGITGPVKFKWDCGGIERNAMAFWLVMIKREVINKIGLLDEIFSPGMGEDGDYCIKTENAGYKLVSVPQNVTGDFDTGIVNFEFPIWHKGNGTFSDNINSKNDVIDRNIKILEDRYGKKVEFSIVIPTAHNFENALKPCIENLLAVTDLSNKEVIVVANGSPPETKNFLDSLKGKIQYIWFKNPLGVVRAYNLGIEKAKGRYIVTLDDDSILLPQPTDSWIKILHKPFVEQEKVGGTSPFANDYEDMGFCLHSGCTMYDASLLREIGMFDEAYNPGYFCDPDVSMKIWNAGYKCVEVPVDRANKEYKDGAFKIDFPVIHMGTVQTMNKHKDAEIVARNRKLLYSRYGKKKVEQENELEIAYSWCLNHPGDINEHFPVLREYASKCEHITEFGTRGVVSTYAFMAGRPKTLITYDITVSPNIWIADRIAKANNIKFAFMERDTTVCDIIEETDLLFVDTKHTYNQVATELIRHANKVRKYIIFHDTESFGVIGENGEPGILNAIEDFIKTKPEWKLRARYYFNNGLIILERAHA